MKDGTRGLASPSQAIDPGGMADFGPVVLEPGAAVFLKALNTDFLSLLQAIPGSVRTEAAFFLLKNAGSSPDRQPNLFRHYYTPSWSILYWIVQQRRCGHAIPDEAVVRSAGTGHVRAMYLHSLDDHLNDGDLPASHLALLIRSQVSQEMKAAFDRIALSVDGGPEIVERLCDDYYRSVCAAALPYESLDDYCSEFVHQMSTCFIAPSLLMKNMGAGDDDIDRLLRAYGAFGISWRLLDDVRDIETDMLQSVRSAVYLCLSAEMKTSWDKGAGEGITADGDRIREIFEYIESNRICEQILWRVRTEMESAVVIAEDIGLSGFSAELRCLLKPLKES